MITCTVCGKENNDLEVICASCKGYLQGRVDTLDLYATMWGLIESPRTTFKRIVLAKHKNYVLLLSSLFGVCFIFDVTWYRSLGPLFSDLIMLAGVAIVLGPLLGLAIVFIASVLLYRISRLFGGQAVRRNIFAALAYALMPMALSLVFIIPLEIAIFGGDFFGTNPPPMVIKPVEYVLLLGLKLVAVLYALILVIEGTMAANAFERKKLFPVALTVVGLVAAGVSIVHFARL